MGDFTGFTFGGVHSSDLGIIRVSSSNRYNNKLQPEIKDRTAEVPGLDGVYYFGSEYGIRSFDIDFAFDSITEIQLRQLKQIFRGKEVKELIFDEYPYKKYIAKLESPVELSFVCFDAPVKTIDTAREGIRVIRGQETTIDEETQEESIVETWEHEMIYPYVTDYSRRQRIYKGEGKISFVCHFPFAKSVYKQLPEESEEWASSSGILSADLYSQFDKYNNQNGIINIYNAGDISTGFRLYCPFEAAQGMRLTYTPYHSANTSILNIKTMVPQINGLGINDIGFLINSDNELIQGVQSFGYDINGNATYVTSGNIYNQYIDSGYFFKLEPNLLYTDEAIIQVTDEENNIINSNAIEIFYDYLYF